MIKETGESSSSKMKLKGLMQFVPPQ